MPRKRFTNDRIAFALRQASGRCGGGRGLCGEMGASEPTFHLWRKQFGGMGVPEMRRLEQREDENGKLVRPGADLTLDRSMLQDVLKRKWRGPPRGRRSPGHDSHDGKLSLSRHRPESISLHPRTLSKSHQTGAIPGYDEDRRLCRA